MESFRKLQFFIKGRLNFLNNGTPPPLEHDLTGKKVIITGGNSGLGWAAALQFARLKADVVIICRNKDRAQTSVAEIKAKSQNPNVSYLLCDLSLLKDISKLCQEKAQKNSVDVLVLNAGVMVNPRTVTTQGVQINFATNVLGTHLMATKMIPAMKEHGKIIIVSSGGMLTQPLKLDDLQMKGQFDGTKQYAINKRQQIALTEFYAKTFPRVGVYAMHPGWADTPGVRTSMPDFYDHFKGKLKTVEEGADTIAWLGVNGGVSGQFYYERKIADKHMTFSRTGYQFEQVQKFISIIDKQIQSILQPK